MLKRVSVITLVILVSMQTMALASSHLTGAPMPGANLGTGSVPTCSALSRSFWRLLRCTTW